MFSQNHHQASPGKFDKNLTSVLFKVIGLVLTSHKGSDAKFAEVKTIFSSRVCKSGEAKRLFFNSSIDN